MNTKIVILALTFACLAVATADPIPRKPTKFDLINALRKNARRQAANDDCSATESPGGQCRPDHNCPTVPDDPVGQCPTPDQDPCAESAYLPHKDNCKYFYQCVRLKPVQMCCPDGTCFDPELNVCV